MEEQTEKTICPLCGSHEYIEPDVDEDLKDEYLESILAGCQFSRTYDLMNGRIAVTVTVPGDEITTKKARLYMNIIELGEKYPAIRNYIPAVEMGLDLDCQLSAIEVFDKNRNSLNKLIRNIGENLDRVNKLDWSKVSKEGSAVDIMEHTIDILQNVFPEYALPKQVLRGAVGKHNVMHTKLIKACLDENFLSGTGR